MILESILFGVVQGITEFLPISSSGHLILLRSFLGGEEGHASLLFDLVLHFVTALVIAVYFYKDIYSITFAGQRKWLPIIVGIIPAAAVGFFYGDSIAGGFRSIYVVIIMLIIGSLLMIIGEIVAKSNKEKKYSQPGIKQMFIMGIFQIVALIPGTSRSGSTIAGGLIAGLSRKTAAKYSFLLGLPLIVGAALLKTMELMKIEKNILFVDAPSLLAGALAAFVSGFVAIHFLMKLLSQRTFWPFIWYRLGLALVLIIFLIP